MTGTFRRSKALVLELKVSGEPEAFGVTGNHLVWSEDRQDWVAVKDLDVGERLRAWDGSTPEVESLTACSEPEPVYNLEVEGDHCYRVGEQGLLVHNASAPNPPLDLVFLADKATAGSVYNLYPRPSAEFRSNTPWKKMVSVH